MMKQKHIYILLAGMITLLSSCIKNDIPYPRIKAQILEFSVEGQIGTTTIDNATQSISIEVADTIDLRRVHIKSIKTTDGASFELPADSIIDLSTSYDLTLSIYQDYTWNISATQNIERLFIVQGGVLESEIDAHNHKAVAYVNEETDLYDIHIDSLVLGPQGITTYSPNPKKINDFSLGFQKVVVSYHNIMEEWTLYVVPTDIKVKTLPVDAWTHVAWFYGSGAKDAVNGFEYKEATAETWTRVPDEYMTYNQGNFSARVIHLKANTSYICRAISGEFIGEEVPFTTGEATPLPNGSFDDWFLDGKVWNPWLQDEPNFWDTGNKGATTLGESNTQPTDDTATGKGLAAQLATKFVGLGSIGKLAAGNIYVGNYVRTDGTNGILDFGKPFTQRPTRMKGFYKYFPVPIDNSSPELAHLKGQPDTCQIYIALGDWDSPLEIRTKPSDRKVFDVNDPHIIAYAGLGGGETIPEYTPFTLELEYRDTNRIPTYIIVVASASKYGDYFTGGNGSVLYIDNFSLEYDY